MAVKANSDIGTKLNVAELVGGEAPETGFEMLVGIRATPEKGEAPEELDATEMHDKKMVNIPGRQNTPSLEYTFNHTIANVTALQVYEGERAAFLETLPEGDGYLIVGSMTFWSNGTGLNEVHEGTINITAEDIEYIEDTSTYLGV